MVHNVSTFDFPCSLSFICAHARAHTQPGAHAQRNPAVQGVMFLKNPANESSIISASKL